MSLLEEESCIKLTPLPKELSSQFHDMLLEKIENNLFQGKKENRL